MTRFLLVVCTWAIIFMYMRYRSRLAALFFDLFNIDSNGVKRENSSGSGRLSDSQKTFFELLITLWASIGIAAGGEVLKSAGLVNVNSLLTNLVWMILFFLPTTLLWKKLELR